MSIFEEKTEVMFDVNRRFRNVEVDINTVDALDGSRFEVNGPVEKKWEGSFGWLRVGAEPVKYADGSPDGVTIRLHAKSGDGQKFTWRRGALEHGYLSSEHDLINLEATIFFRVRGYNRTHTSVSWILRGGLHEGVHDPRSSCIGLQIPCGGLEATIFKELDHPDYDFITVPRKFDYSLEENKWVGFKAVSFLEKAKKRTRNFVYINRDPFLGGNRKPGFELYSQWIDQDGLSTGKYSQAALWSGCRTTFRLDGWKSMDFYCMSVYGLEDRSW